MQQKSTWGLLLPLSQEILKTEFQKEFSHNQEDKMKAVLLTLQSSSHKTFYFFKIFSFWCPTVNPMWPKDDGLGPRKKSYTTVPQISHDLKKPNKHLHKMLLFLSVFKIHRLHWLIHWFYVGVSWFNIAWVLVKEGSTWLWVLGCPEYHQNCREDYKSWQD